MEKTQLIIYQSEDGKVKIETRMEGETIWLTQKLMAELFQTTPQNITIHLKNIFEEGELNEQSTCKEFLQVQSEGKREVKRQQKYCNLDAILSVGYRIKSHVATRFRKWATVRPTKQEAETAKNYLNEEELNILNRMVTAYLELAELQALNRRPMYMKDWIARLDDFLKMTGNDILTHADKISHQKALEKARSEYEKYHQQQLQQPTQAEKDYIRHIEYAAKKLNKKKGN